MRRFSIRTLMTLIAGFAVGLAALSNTNDWRSALPGAANHDQFLRIGHYLFALLAGLVGGTVAVWFWGRRERGEAGSAN